MRLIKVFALVPIILALMVGTTHAQILFEEDFESGELDRDKWVGAAVWKVIDNETGDKVLEDFVLDVLGGEEGLGIEEFPENYDYYAHFRSMNGLAGFIFHGQDGNNIYMHQISATGSAYTPNNTRWHRKVAGTYSAEPEPFQDGVTIDQEVWYKIRFEVRGIDFKLFLGDVDADYDELTLIGEWTDSQSAFTSGKIGFRMSGTEHAQYDNVSVRTPGYGLAVGSRGKLAITWGEVKEKI